jgi:AcrR family transcriptional regulator
MGAANAGRPNQRRRTRKDLLLAASHLMKQGRKPTLDEVAGAALVSRATAYRYFPSVEPLLLEASLDVATPEPDTLFANDTSQDPVARVERVDRALHDLMLANEAQLRMMLMYSLERRVSAGPDGDVPARQNRRTPLLEAALAPARGQFRPAELDLLCKTLAVLVGTDAMVVFKDVLQLDDAGARKVKRWAIRALIDAARKPVKPARGRAKSGTRPR